MEIDPEDAVARYGLGIVYDMMNQRDLAMAEYQRAVELNPNMAEAQFNLAVDYYHFKRFDLAWKHVHIAEKLGVSTQRINQLITALRKISGEH
jgi:Flp pilus assembly protein TadD